MSIPLSVRLLKVLRGEYLPTMKEAMILFNFATLNRIPLSLLLKLPKDILCDKLIKIKASLLDKYKISKEELLRTAAILNKEEIDYAFYKVKPYIETTVDLDIIIFDKHRYAVAKLLRKGYRIMGYGAYSITLESPKGMPIDLYREIATHRYVFIDKEILRNHVISRNINGEIVNFLSPEADLLAVSTHSVMKEQLFVISDYLTTITYLDYINPQRVTDLAEILKVTKAMKTYLTIAWNLASIVEDKSKSMKLAKMIHLLGGFNLRESIRFKKAKFETPHHFSITTFLNSLMENYKSIAWELYGVMKFSELIYASKSFSQHLTRATY